LIYRSNLFVRPFVGYVPVLDEKVLNLNHFSFSSIKHPHEIPTGSPPVAQCGGDKYRWGMKISRFSTNKSLYLADDTRYGAIVTMEGEYETAPKLLNSTRLTSFNDPE